MLSNKPLSVLEAAFSDISAFVCLEAASPVLKLLVCAGRANLCTANYAKELTTAASCSQEEKELRVYLEAVKGSFAALYHSHTYFL